MSEIKMTTAAERRPEPNYQNAVLAQAKKEKTPVTVFLTSGFQIRGTVKGFDNYIIMVDSDGKQQMMIYKHAISTVVPMKPFEINIGKLERMNTNQ